MLCLWCDAECWMVVMMAMVVMLVILAMVMMVSMVVMLAMVLMVAMVVWCARGVVRSVGWCPVCPSPPPCSHVCWCLPASCCQHQPSTPPVLSRTVCRSTLTISTVTSSTNVLMVSCELLLEMIHKIQQIRYLVSLCRAYECN